MGLFGSEIAKQIILLVLYRSEQILNFFFLILMVRLHVVFHVNHG